MGVSPMWLHKPGPPVLKLESGVRVTGADPETLNGFYHQRDNAKVPPKKWRSDPEQWFEETADRPWYEKDDGCFIQQLAHPHPEDGRGLGEWRWFDSTGELRSTYAVETESGIPPATGWKTATESETTLQ